MSIAPLLALTMSMTVVLCHVAISTVYFETNYDDEVDIRIMVMVLFDACVRPRQHRRSIVVAVLVCAATIVVLAFALTCVGLNVCFCNMRCCQSRCHGSRGGISSGSS